MKNLLNIYYCGQQNCLPNHSYGPAVRTHYLLHIILEGKGTFHTGGNTHRLKTYDAFLIQPGEVTFYQADETIPWKYAWIGFDGEIVEELLNEAGLIDKSIFSFKSIENELIKSFENILAHFITHQRHTFLMMSDFYQIFYHLSTLEKKSPNILIHNYVDLAISYIKTNYHQDISVQSIADYIGIERTYFYRLFKKHMDTSPSEFLIMHRINTSLKLLEETNLPITTIAFSCGFNDASTYCRHFKSIIRRTPTSYRKNVQS